MIIRKIAVWIGLSSMVTLISILSIESTLGQFGDFGAQGSGEITLEASGVIVPPTGDQPAVLIVSGILDDSLWTYSITQPPGGPVRTKIKIDKSDSYQVGDFVSISEPKVVPEKFATIVNSEKHFGGNSWYAPLQLSAGVKLEELEIKGKIFAQVCTAENCFPPKDYRFTAKVGVAPFPVPKVMPLDPIGDSNKREANADEASAPDQPKTTSEVPPGLPHNTDESSQMPPGMSNESTPTIGANYTNYDIEQLVPQTTSSSSSLPLMIVAALLAGFILNFMPCVLPVVGLKLLSFLEQGGSNPRRVLALNLWYSLGIVAVFWVLAGLAVAVQAGLGTAYGVKEFGWGAQFHFDKFNITLVAIVFVMALSFLGVWEIPIPGFASSRNAQELARKEGALGAFVKGVITTVLATPCSGPFLGTAVGFAIKSTPVITFAIFTVMGLGMAAPYILVGFRPSLIRLLPKPGAWMDTFKQLMGFALIATVLWLMLPISERLVMPTLTFLAALAAGCWWVGRTPGYAEFGQKLKSWAQASAFVAVAGWLAFAAPQITDPLPWREFSMSRFVSDVNSDQTVMVEFTAEWCATCKALKATCLDRSKTKDKVRKNNVIVYEVDIDKINDEERQFFSKMQPSNAVPLVAIFPAGKKYHPISFGNGYTQSQILQALEDAGPSQSKNQ